MGLLRAGGDSPGQHVSRVPIIYLIWQNRNDTDGKPRWELAEASVTGWQLFEDFFKAIMS